MEDRTGVERIAVERRRQIDVEGYGLGHDREHSNGELINAAICYAYAGAIAQTWGVAVHFGQEGERIKPPAMWKWPWHPGYWKPSDDPIRNLEKAGALIAAEIDRLQKP